MTKSIAITKEMIDQAAVSVVRKSGLSALTARNVANELHCSTQPIYNVYGNMENLKKVTLVNIQEFITQSIIRYKRTDYEFLDSGLGYIHFAQTEKALFRSFELNEQSPEHKNNGIGNKKVRELMEMELRTYPFSKKDLDKIFLQIMIFTYGLAVMHFLDFCEFNEETIAEMLQESFNSFIAQVKGIKE